MGRISQGNGEKPFRIASMVELNLAPGRYHRLMQVIGRVRRGDDQDPLRDAREVAAAWLKKKGWALAPNQLLSDRPVHFEDENSTRALSIESAEGLWAARIDDPCSQVAGRQWRVELVLADMGKDEFPAFGCTLSVLIPAGVDEVIRRPGIPGVVGSMARSQELKEAGRLLDGRVWEIDRPGEIDDFIAFLESPSRPFSVIAVSSDDKNKSFCNANALSKALSGLAVVAVISADAAKEITRRYGRAFGIFGDAVRIYRVGFNPDLDDRYRNPLFISSSWRQRVRQFMDVASSVAMADTVLRRDDQRDVPSFGVIRAIAADHRIKTAVAQGGAGSAEVAQISADIDALRQSAESWERLALDEDMRAQQAEEDQRQTLARLHVYADRIRKLEEKLEYYQASRDIDFDRSLDQIADWSEEFFAGRLVVTARAARAAAASDHADPETIYRSLSLLGTEYWKMKVEGGSDFQLKCKEAEAALGVRISPSGDAVDMRQYEKEYRVRWEGKQYKLDMHLAGSDSRDKRRGLRIYFAWDEEQELVVVGHLPTHLTNVHT